MIILRFLLIAVTVISSVLLLILILLQKTKADGLGLAFGSGMGEALFGSRAGNILSKLTIAFACVFLTSTLLLSILFAGGRGRSLMSQQMGVMADAMSRSAPQQGPTSAPQASPPGSSEPVGGAPTLPGANLGDQGNPPPSPAPAETPTPQSIPAPVETPAP
jgi:preprotein translocase subunit SecG